MCDGVARIAMGNLHSKSNSLNGVGSKELQTVVFDPGGQMRIRPEAGFDEI